MNDIKRKLTSRKFWLCTAAFLASIATSVQGLNSDNEAVVAIGTISAVLSAAIYAAAEAAVDKSHIGENPQEDK